MRRRYFNSFCVFTVKHEKKGENRKEQNKTCVPRIEGCRYTEESVHAFIQNKCLIQKGSNTVLISGHKQNDHACGRESKYSRSNSTLWKFMFVQIVTKS